jgi:hypothetical protein
MKQNLNNQIVGRWYLELLLLIETSLWLVVWKTDSPGELVIKVGLGKASGIERYLSLNRDFASTVPVRNSLKKESL